MALFEHVQETKFPAEYGSAVKFVILQLSALKIPKVLQVSL